MHAVFNETPTSYISVKGGDFTGMLCAPRRIILSMQLSHDLIIPAYASGDHSGSNGDYQREL